jgi:hypothetical protein
MLFDKVLFVLHNGFCHFVKFILKGKVLCHQLSKKLEI